MQRKYVILAVGIIGGAVISLFALSGILSLRWGIWTIFAGISVTVFSALWLCLFIFSKNTDKEVILTGFRYLFSSGLAAVFVGLSLLAGVYIREISSGQMETRWAIFWPTILAACVLFWVGTYKKIISTGIAVFQQWERFLNRADTEPGSFLRRLWEEVILQKTLREQSTIRWLRHILIYWGFVLLWITDMLFAFLLEYLPILGFPHFSEVPHLRTGFKFFLESFGLLILTGTFVALIWGFAVRRTDSKIYRDTPTVAFLFCVVLTGYLTEGARFASLSYVPAMSYSFFGNFIASLIRDRGLSYAEVHQGLWYLHMILACSFIAYVPVRRLIHSCAVPVGKLMQSQKILLDAKLSGVVSGLLSPEEIFPKK